MLPPIPHSLAPITAQQDVIKPRPDIQPVTPVNESSQESAVELDRRHPQEAEELLREEQRRRQRRGYTPEE
ncbi:MAG: aspartate-semialdehyde dehydrogenase, partial [Pseudomonas sp.]